ncbi:MAG: 6-bladed beta-propeller [Bacteroidales bacterium]|nr:6-bladed beta-propeller [Bacteroidales bacterium]
MNRLLAILFCVAIVTGCAKKEQSDTAEPGSPEIIDLDEVLSAEYSKDSTSVDKARLIPLEATDESLIGFIESIKIGGKYMYIGCLSSDFELMIFDTDGHYVNRLKTGNGPGEVAYPEKFTYDKYRDQLLVYQYGTVKKYSPTGEYIGNCTIPFCISDFVAIVDGYLVIISEIQNQSGAFWALKTDTDFNVVKDIRIDAPYRRFSSDHITENADNEIIIPHAYDNNLYVYTDSTVTVKQILKYDDHQYDLSNINDMDEGELSRIMLHSEKTLFTKFYYETNNYQRFDMEPFFPIFRNKVNNRCTAGRFSQIPLHFVVGTCGEYFVGWCNNELISFDTKEAEDNYYKAMTALTPEEVSALRNMSPDDNPFVLLFSLK